MKNYELLCLIKTLDVESVEQTVKSIEEAIKNLGGSVQSIDKMGRKKLAYEISKSRDAFYTVFNVEIEVSKIVELKKYLKLNENIIRNMLTLATPTVAK